MTERTLAGKDKSTTLLSDQRGAVAFETLIVWLFLMMGLLLPLADLAIAGFKFVSAWGALRTFGQYAQYHSPQVVASKLGTTVAGYPINDLQVICGDAKLVCSATNVASPKYYSYTTTVALSPMVLSVLCCSFTLSYSERFQ